MALGWPVTENGPEPGLPIRPVARWQFRMALTLSVPEADWFTPCEYTVITRSVAANRSKKCRTFSSASPVAVATAPMSPPPAARAADSAASNPVVWRDI